MGLLRGVFAALAATATFAAFYLPIYLLWEEEWILREFEIVSPTTPPEVLMSVAAIAATGVFLRLAFASDLIWHYLGKYLVTIAWPLYAYLFIQTPGEPFGTVLLKLQQSPEATVTIWVDVSIILLIMFAIAALSIVHVTLQMMHRAEY